MFLKKNIYILVQFCLSRWNNLRGQFQKELKHCNELCPKSGVIRGSTWPYLERMRFLEGTVQANKTKKKKLSKRKLKELQELEQEPDWKDEDTESRHSEEIEVGGEEQIHEYQIEEITDTIQEEPQVIEETYVEDEDYSMIEEIAEEVVGTEHIEQTEDDYATDDTVENYHKMQALLNNFEEETLQTIERRLMAFLCKCQLRALNDQSIDDLFV